MAITTEAKLAVYNGALRRLGSRQIASLTEAREPRRVLDSAWGADNDAVLTALERADWNFATRASQLTYETSITPGFGWTRAFAKPADLVRLTSLSDDAFFQRPLTDREYVEEANYWYCGYDTVYVRYVSSNTNYGLDSGKWPSSFKDYLECWLAWTCCERITNSTTKKVDLARDMRDSLKAAKSIDAMAEGVKFPPRGSWAAAKVGRTRTREQP